MNHLKKLEQCKRYFRYHIAAGIILLCYSVAVSGQEFPPRPISVTVNLSQNLNFGAFYQGSAGGTVIISPTGSRSYTGDVVLLNLGYSFSTALYDVVANPGTLVSIMNGSDVMLSGSNGGTMILKIGLSDPTSPFIVIATPPSVTQIKIGGTLFVGNPLANPPGNYSGTFNVTFIQE